MTHKNNKTEENQKTEEYSALKRILAGDASTIPCFNRATGCQHHK